MYLRNMIGRIAGIAKIAEIEKHRRLSQNRSIHHGGAETRRKVNNLATRGKGGSGEIAGIAGIARIARIAKIVNCRRFSPVSRRSGELPAFPKIWFFFLRASVEVFAFQSRRCLAISAILAIL
jgi:hypothetical protein